MSPQHRILNSVILASVIGVLFCFASDDSSDRRPPWDAALIVSFNTGDASDRSYAANVPTLSNGASLTGTYLTLDGTNDLLSYPEATALDMPGAFTVSAWVQPSTPGSSARAIVGRYVTSGTSRSWLFAWRYDLAGTPLQGITFLDGGSSNIAQYLFAATLPTSGWHHTAMVFDSSAAAGSRMKAYLDGEAVANSSIPNENAYTPFDTGLITTVGSYGTIASPIGGWKGDMDGVRIYRRALSATEIAQIYAGGR